MGSPDDLAVFVRDALARGVARADIQRTLAQAGWSDQQVTEALAAWADVAFPVPVPRPRASTDAREAFLYVLMTLVLGLAAYNVGAFLFELIEYAFPIGSDRDFFAEHIRWPVAILVVAMPVFFYVLRLINRDLRMDPGKRASRNRVQTTYIALFICASIVIGVMAGVVYNFLGGELTTRFVLKSATAAGIAAGLFAWYLRDMRAAGVTPGGDR